MSKKTKYVRLRFDFVVEYEQELDSIPESLSQNFTVSMQEALGALLRVARGFVSGPRAHDKIPTPRYILPGKSSYKLDFRGRGKDQDLLPSTKRARR